MMKSVFRAAAVVLLSACASNPSVQTASGVLYPGVTPANGRFVPSGTILTAKLDQAISVRSTSVGDRVTATVSDPVIARNGETAIPAGAILVGHVTGISSGDASTQAVVRLNFD